MFSKDANFVAHYSALMEEIRGVVSMQENANLQLSKAPLVPRYGQSYWRSPLRILVIGHMELTGVSTSDFSPEVSSQGLVEDQLDLFQRRNFADTCSILTPAVGWFLRLILEMEKMANWRAVEHRRLREVLDGLAWASCAYRLTENPRRFRYDPRHNELYKGFLLFEVSAVTQSAPPMVTLRRLKVHHFWM